MKVRKWQLEPDMEQQNGSKFGKEYIKAVYCHPAQMPGWMNHKVESRLPGEISITSDIQMLLLLSHVWLCDPMDCSKPGFPVHHLPKLAKTHVHWVHLILCHPLSPPALSLSQHQGVFQWVGSSNKVANILEVQLQHQSFQWILRVDFL